MDGPDASRALVERAFPPRVAGAELQHCDAPACDTRVNADPSPEPRFSLQQRLHLSRCRPQLGAVDAGDCDSRFRPN